MLPRTSEPNFVESRRSLISSVRKRVLGPLLVDAAFDEGVDFQAAARSDAPQAPAGPVTLRNEGPLLSNLAEQLQLLKAQERRLRELIETAKRS